MSVERMSISYSICSGCCPAWKSIVVDVSCVDHTPSSTISCNTTIISYSMYTNVYTCTMYNVGGGPLPWIRLVWLYLMPDSPVGGAPLCTYRHWVSLLSEAAQFKPNPLNCKQVVTPRGYMYMKIHVAQAKLVAK